MPVLQFVSSLRWRGPSVTCGRRWRRTEISVSAGVRQISGVTYADRVVPGREVDSKACTTSNDEAEAKQNAHRLCQAGRPEERASKAIKTEAHTRTTMMTHPRLEILSQRKAVPRARQKATASAKRSAPVGSHQRMHECCSQGGTCAPHRQQCGVAADGAAVTHGKELRADGGVCRQRSDGRLAIGQMRAQPRPRIML
jgi:hypothetical protein